MSKKLIAVAAAAALALTGLVAVPAGASAITNVVITYGGTAGSAGGVEDSGNIQTNTASHTNSDAAVAVATFSADRKVYFGNTTDAATRTAVRLVVNTAAAATVSVTSTLGVKISAATTDAAGAALSVTAGAQTLSGSTSAANLAYTFYAWNTSTTPGAITIDTGTSRMTFYVKGVAFEAYDLSDIVFPTSLYIGQTTGKITFKMSDAYGNPVTTGTGPTPTGFGATFAAATYSATTKLWSAAVSTVTGDNVAMNLAITPQDLSATGFAKPVKSAFQLLSAGDAAAQVVTLTAQVAALQATIDGMRTKANSVTKKRWNNLVKRYRALGGSAKLK